MRGNQLISNQQLATDKGLIPSRVLHQYALRQVNLGKRNSPEIVAVGVLRVELVD